MMYTVASSCYHFLAAFVPGKEFAHASTLFCDNLIVTAHFSRLVSGTLVADDFSFLFLVDIICFSSDIISSNKLILVV